MTNVQDGIDNPGVIDALLNEPKRLTPREFGQSELGRVRWAQVLNTRGTAQAAAQAAQITAELNVPPARGVRMLAQVALRLYEEVAATDAEPTGSSLLELEDACHAHSAAGMANAELQRYQVAVRHISSAITLARALGLSNRLQMLEIELCRILNLTGAGDADRMRLALIPISAERRLLWGQRVLAETHLSQGSYSDALNALGTPDDDGPREAAMREFIHALLGLPPARTPDDPIHNRQDTYLRLAQGLRQLAHRKGQPEMQGIQGFPEQAYAQIVEAISLIRKPRMAVAAALALGSQPPRWADQQAYWAVVRISAFAEGAPDVDPLEAVQVLKNALAQLRSPREVMQTIRNLAPDRYMLLQLGPTAELAQTLGLPAVPILTGQHVIRGEERVRLIGRTGRTLLLEAAKVADRDDLHSYERGRAEAAVAHMGGLERIANMGWVLRATYRLRGYAAQVGDEAALTEWDIAYQRTWSLLSKDVRSALQEYAPNPLESEV